MRIKSCRFLHSCREHLATLVLIIASSGPRSCVLGLPSVLHALEYQKSTPLSGMPKLEKQPTFYDFQSKPQQHSHDDENISYTRSSCPDSWIVPDLNQLRKLAGQGAVQINSNTAIDNSTHYVFVSGMAYTGTTGLLGLLSTSPKVSNLCSAKTIACEGSWLLHASTGQKEYRNFWNGELIQHQPFEEPEDWNEALPVFHQYWDSSKPVLVDKSPHYQPHLFKIYEDLNRSGHQTSFIYVTNSACYRSLPKWNDEAPEMVRQLAKLRAAGARVHVVKSEEMLGDPYGVTRMLLEFLPALRSLDPTASGISGAPYVRPGDSRTRSMVEFAQESGPRRFAGSNRSLSSVENATMIDLGYSRAWLETSSFIQEHGTFVLNRSSLGNQNKCRSHRLRSITGLLVVTRFLWLA